MKVLIDECAPRALRLGVPAGEAEDVEPRFLKGKNLGRSNGSAGMAVWLE